MPDSTHDLAIIGAGNMAEAIARGVLKSGVLPADRIIATDVSPQRRELFSKELGVTAVEDNTQAVTGAGCVLLSVKPQMMNAVLTQLRPSLTPRSLIVSIAAGVKTAKIETALGEGKWRVVRAMPNTPMLVGEGMVALCRGTNATEADLEAARCLFESAAVVIDVEESQMDAVTAVSGSGPAYVFYLAEQMIAAAKSLGMSPEQSRTLALRTIVGAAKMLGSTTEEPAELRRKVTSPGGTTQAAIEHLEKTAVGKNIVDAIAAAEARGKQLGG